MERCWGVLVSDHCNLGDENSHGVGGYLVEKVFGVVFVVLNSTFLFLLFSL